MLKKKLDELTLKDNFMFCAVMADVDNCRGLLEMLLSQPDGHGAFALWAGLSGAVGLFCDICLRF